MRGESVPAVYETALLHRDGRCVEVELNAGVTAYRVAFGRPRAAIGPQPEGLGPARLWILPNPSGLNASWQLPRLATAFRELRAAAVP